jgi:hypothetical protein
MFIVTEFLPQPSITTYFAGRAALSEQADRVLQKLRAEPSLADDLKVITNLALVKHSVVVILGAFQNPRKSTMSHCSLISLITGLIPWSLKDLASSTTGFNVKKGITACHQDLMTIFPPGDESEGVLAKSDAPCVFADVDGLVSVIHLPGVYHDSLTVSHSCMAYLL